jgi:acyl transferase domain-containing protein
LVISPAGLQRASFQIYSQSSEISDVEAAGARELHTTGLLARVQPDTPEAKNRSEGLAQHRAACSQTVPVVDCYARLKALGLEYGPAFQGLAEIWTGQPGSGEAFGQVVLPAEIADDSLTYVAHPVLIDASWHLLSVAAATLPRARAGADEARLPAGISRVTVRGRLGRAAWAHARFAADETTGVHLADVELFDEAGTSMVEVQGLRLTPVRQLPSAETATSGPRTETATVQTGPSFSERLRAAPEGERLALMVDFLRLEIANVAGFDPNEPFDVSATLIEVGLTSLMATELQYRIQRGLGVQLPARAPLDLESVETMANSLLALVMAPPPAEEPSGKKKGAHRDTR